MLQLKDQNLLKANAYINGSWVAPKADKKFAVMDPATGETICEVPNLAVDDTRDAIAAAEDALPEWKRRTAKDRAKLMRQWFDLIMENRDDLARIMTAEQGKPLQESRGEVAYGAAFIEWFAEEGKRVYGDVIPAPAEGKRIIVSKEAIGVVAAITPWNFPNAMITRKCAPALAAGCTFVIKPPSETPLSALALAELADRAGIPKGVFNVVTTTHSEAVGRELTENPTVKKFTFTGSTAVGKQLMAQCASTVKKVTLELGGNAPFIVFDDADIPAAVAGAMASKFRNMGQTCVCANRIFVQKNIAAEFTAQLTEKVQALKVGNGFDEGVEQGPLITDKAVDKVERLIGDATRKGARIITGGKRHQLGATFFEPTVIGDTTMQMDIAREEIFGPVATLYKFKDEDDAIAMANDTQYGLAAYFYARDIGRIMRVAERLEYGIVGINEGIISTEVAPFGGMKQSGIGREGSKYGIEDYLEIKYMQLGGLQR